jgi:hypothetical protein
MSSSNPSEGTGAPEGSGEASAPPPGADPSSSPPPVEGGSDDKGELALLRSYYEARQSLVEAHKAQYADMLANLKEVREDPRHGPFNRPPHATTAPEEAGRQVVRCDQRDAGLCWANHKAYTRNHQRRAPSPPSFTLTLRMRCFTRVWCCCCCCRRWTFCT